MDELDIEHITKITENLLLSGELNKLKVKDENDLKLKNSVEDGIQDIKEYLEEDNDQEDIDQELKNELSEIYSNFTNELNNFFDEYVNKDKKRDAKLKLYSILITNFFDKMRDEEKDNPCCIL